MKTLNMELVGFFGLEEYKKGFGKIRVFDKILSRWQKPWSRQGSQIRQIWRILRQNCSADSTEVTEGVTSTPEIFGKKKGATSTPEIWGTKHSFVLTVFTTNTIHVNCKRCKP